MNRKHFTIPIFVPEAACPFQCVFCDQKRITGKLKAPDQQETEKIIEEHLKTLPKDSFIEIGFFGGSFTGIPLKEQERYLKTAYDYMKSGKVHGIRLSTRPDYIDQEKLDLLKRYRVSAVEIGAQSLDALVLKKAGRGHTAGDVSAASRMVREAGFQLGLQMMLGLPGDTIGKSIRTAKSIVRLQADFVRIYPTLVIRGTALEKMALAGSYTPLSMEEAVKWSAAVVKVFDKAGIPIIRLGIHPSEGLITKTSLSAGPFHPAFRELVETTLWKEKLRPLLKNKKGTNAVITVPQKELNYAVGHKGQNKKMLLEHFQNVGFRTSRTINGRNFYADIS
jgi:histone acetyltransferase (RNA polymerase elongator complex component)